MAIKGEGFFIVKKLNKEEKYYTRKGNFTLNEESYIVTTCGKFLLDQNENPISWHDADCLNQIKVATFKNVKSIKYVDIGLFVSDEEPETKTEFEVLKVPSETNSVDLADVFIELLEKQNEVAQNSKVIIPLKSDQFK